jgi:hypothetical protein
MESTAANNGTLLYVLQMNGISHYWIVKRCLRRFTCYMRLSDKSCCERWTGNRLLQDAAGPLDDVPACNTDTRCVIYRYHKKHAAYPVGVFGQTLDGKGPDLRPQERDTQRLQHRQGNVSEPNDYRTSVFYVHFPFFHSLSPWLLQQYKFRCPWNPALPAVAGVPTARSPPPSRAPTVERLKNRTKLLELSAFTNSIVPAMSFV